MQLVAQVVQGTAAFSTQSVFYGYSFSYLQAVLEPVQISAENCTVTLCFFHCGPLLHIIALEQHIKI
jgi:hypothetical protein